MVSGLRRFKIVACLILGMLIASTVSAEEIPPRAVESMEEGALLFENGEYGAATVEFRRAFEITPYAIFIWNAGRAAHQNENYRQAYLYYGQALDVKEEGKRLSPDLRGRAAGLKEALGVRSAAERMALEAKNRRPEIEEVRWSRWGWGGVGLAGGGVAMLVGATGFGMATSRGFNGLDGVETMQEYRHERDQIERNQRLGRIFLYGGSTLLVLGAVVTAWDLSTIEERAVPVVSISSTSMSAVWEVRF